MKYIMHKRKKKNDKKNVFIKSKSINILNKVFHLNLRNNHHIFTSWTKKMHVVKPALVTTSIKLQSNLL